MLKRRFITSYNTKKMAKDKFKTAQKGRCFVTCLDGHGSRHEQPKFQHLVNCQLYT